MKKFTNKLKLNVSSVWRVVTITGFLLSFAGVAITPTIIADRLRFLLFYRGFGDAQDVIAPAVFIARGLWPSLLLLTIGATMLASGLVKLIVVKCRPSK